MTDTPFFSLITVTHNNLKGLKRTHSSVDTQTCRDFEWIVVDGASDDGTRNYLAGSSADWTSEPDSGIYDAMNKGMARANGRYLLFLNAGDRLASADILETLRESIRSGPTSPGLVYGDSLEERPDGGLFLKKARSHRRARQGMFTHHQAMLYRRETFDGMRYDLRYAIAADYDLTLRALKTGAHVLYVPVAVCVFECGGVSQRRTRQGRAEQFAIRAALNICPASVNHAIRAKQILAQSARRLCPGLYRLAKGRMSAVSVMGLDVYGSRKDIEGNAKR